MLPASEDIVHSRENEDPTKHGRVPIYSLIVYRRGDREEAKAAVIVVSFGVPRMSTFENIGRRR